MKKFLKSSTMMATYIGFALIMAWNVLWCAATTFRGMSFITTYTSAILAALILALPTFLGCKRWVQTLIWLIIAGVLESNLMYCRTYLSWIPLESYLLVGNLGDFTASVADSVRWADIIIFVIPFAIFLAKPQQVRVNKRWYWGSVLVFAVATFLASCIYGGMPKHVEYLRNECYYSTTPPIIYTLAGPLMSEVFSSEGTLSDEDYAFAKQWMDTQAAQDSEYPITEREIRKNLVIIYCESLESWLIDAEVNTSTGQPQPLTPFLNSLVADSTTLYMPHVRSQVGTGRSIDAQLLMLAGMYPLDNKVYSMKYPFHTYLTIPQAMVNRDPETATLLLTCDKPITWNQQLVAEAFGVDSIISRDSWEMTELVGNPAKLSDGAFMKQSVDKLQAGEIWQEGTPAYLHFVTYSGHNPFKLPEHLKGIEIAGDYPERMHDYMTMANYTDRSLQPLIDYLKTRSDWDETMVVIVGDHEALGTYRQDWLKNPTAAKVLSAQTEVPLIILNSPVAGRIDDPIGQVDVYSTIVDLMSLRPYAWVGMGQSALNPKKTTIDEPDEHAANAAAASQIIITHDLLKDESISHMPQRN